MWTPRTNSRDYDEEEDDDENESYLSCDSESNSDTDEYFTPPQSPCHDSSDDEMNAFEESLENVDDEKEYALFING